MHFPVNTKQFTSSIDDGCAVVVQASGTLLKNRRNDDHVLLHGDFLESLCGWAGDGLCQFEICVVLALAEILRGKKFLGADNLRTFFCGMFGGGQGALQVVFGVAGGLLLEQGEGRALRV